MFFWPDDHVTQFCVALKSFDICNVEMCENWESFVENARVQIAHSSVDLTEFLNITTEK